MKNKQQPVYTWNNIPDSLADEALKQAVDRACRERSTMSVYVVTKCAAGSGVGYAVRSRIEGEPEPWQAPFFLVKEVHPINKYDDEEPWQ